MRETFGEVWRNAISHLRFYNCQEQDVVCKPFQEMGLESEPVSGPGQVSRGPRGRKAAGRSSQGCKRASHKEKET